MRIHINEVEELTFGGCEIFKPEFREMNIRQIEDELQEQLQSYFNVGYNHFTFHRKSSIVFVRRIKIETLEDIFETDNFHLLQD